MLLAPAEFSTLPQRFNLFQSGFWAFFRNGGTNRSFAFIVDPGGGRPSFPLVLIARGGISDNRYAYAPHGPDLPLDEGDRGLFLEELSLSLQKVLPPGLACIRYDLPFLSPYTDSRFWTSAGQWKGAPRPELRELRMNYGTRLRLLRKAPLDHFSPDTVIISLREAEEVILSRMRQTTRNCVRKSLKSGLSFRVAGAEALPVWHELYSETARRKGFYFEGLAYFEKLFRDAEKFADLSRASGSPASAAVSDCSSTIGDSPAGGNPVPRFFVLLAELEDVPLAGIILGVCGTRGYYLYAGSSSERRDAMPNYGLQWEAIKLLKSMGCLEYDLMGVPPNGDPGHSMYGLYTFKTGLGGKIIHYAGCWDFPLDSDRYEHQRNAENLGGIR